MDGRRNEPTPIGRIAADVVSGIEAKHVAFEHRELLVADRSMQRAGQRTELRDRLLIAALCAFMAAVPVMVWLGR